jgi:hypothetical protein
MASRLSSTPPVLGRLLTPKEVAAQYFDGHVTPQWITRHVRPRVEVTSRLIRFYEKDVEAWLASRRAA